MKLLVLTTALLAWTSVHADSNPSAYYGGRYGGYALHGGYGGYGSYRGGVGYGGYGGVGIGRGSVAVHPGYGGYARAGSYVACNPGACHIAKRSISKRSADPALYYSAYGGHGGYGLGYGGYGSYYGTGLGYAGRVLYGGYGGYGGGYGGYGGHGLGYTTVYG